MEHAQEYCMFETFDAHCGEGSVIQMNWARFGRMSLGRCLKENYGNLGCATDVLYKFDEKLVKRYVFREQNIT